MKWIAQYYKNVVKIGKNLLKSCDWLTLAEPRLRVLWLAVTHDLECYFSDISQIVRTFCMIYSKYHWNIGKMRIKKQKRILCMCMFFGRKKLFETSSSKFIFSHFLSPFVTNYPSSQRESLQKRWPSRLKTITASFRCCCCVKWWRSIIHWNWVWLLFSKLLAGRRSALMNSSFLIALPETESSRWFVYGRQNDRIGSRFWPSRHSQSLVHQIQSVWAEVEKYNHSEAFSHHKSLWVLHMCQELENKFLWNNY